MVSLITAYARQMRRAGRFRASDARLSARPCSAARLRRRARPAAIAVLVAVLLAPAAARADPVVAAAGDIACDPVTANGSQNPRFNGGAGTASECHARDTADQLLDSPRGQPRSDLAAVLLLGDIQYEDGSYCKYVGTSQGLSDGVACPVMSSGSPMPGSYADSWGGLKRLTRPALGNHEYGDGQAPNLWTTQVDRNATGYFRYFAPQLESLGPTAGIPSQGYYSFDVSVGTRPDGRPVRWHFVALNSECAAGLAAVVGWAGGCAASSAQANWLRDDLSRSDADCTVAYWHHPLFSSGSIGNIPAVRPLWQVLQEHGADVVINGHDHDYERFAPQDAAGSADTAHGIREFVVGTGGKNQLPLGTVTSNSQARNNTTFGVLELTLHPPDAAHPTGSYHWLFRDDMRSGGFAGRRLGRLRPRAHGRRGHRPARRRDGVEREDLRHGPAARPRDVVPVRVWADHCV